MFDRYQKPFKTVDEQLTILKERGLQVFDDENAIRQLRQIGYYRLSGYWYPLRVVLPVPTTDPGLLSPTVRSARFQPNADFSRVVEDYEFDRGLRLLVLDGLERLEVAMRFQVGHSLGAGHPYAHLDFHSLSPSFTGVNDSSDPFEVHAWLESEHSKWLAKVKRQETSSKEEFVKHFRSKYGPGLPVWVVTEILDFGGLSTLYEGLKQQERDSIADYFGVGDGSRGDGAALASWMRNLNYIRNICAHHGRLWNRNIVVQGSDLSVFDDLNHAASSQSRVYASLAFMAYMLSRTQPDGTWRTKVVSYMDSSAAGEKQARMGFPDCWNAERIWDPAYAPMPDPEVLRRRSLRNAFECVAPTDMGRLLFPELPRKESASKIRSLRSSHKLLALRVLDEGAFEFPLFQFDQASRELVPIVAYANQRLEVAKHPWEAAEWWASAKEPLGGKSPAQALVEGALSELQIDMCIGQIT